MKIEVLKGSKTSKEILTMIHTHAYIKTLYILLSLFYYELQHNFDERNKIVSVENGIVCYFRPIPFLLLTPSRTLAYDLHISNTDPQ